MYKLLIADDETEMRKMLVAYMKQDPDIDVIGSASNGEEALMAIQEYHPDIVLTDVCMPKMDGLELLKETAQRGIDVKAIIISGYNEYDYAREAISLGVTDYLLKPFSPLELKNTIDKIKRELNSQKQLAANLLRMSHRGGRSSELEEFILGGNEIESIKSEVITTSDNYYCVCLMHLPSASELESWGTKSLDYMKMIVELLRENYFHKELRVDGFCAEDKSIILIFTGSDSLRKPFLYEVKNGLDTLQKSLKKYYDIRTICVIGGVHNCWKDLRKSYREAKTLWDHTLSTSQEIIIYESEPKKETNVTEQEAVRQIKSIGGKIIIAVRMSREEEAAALVHELMQKYTLTAPRNLQDVGMSVGELIFEIFMDLENSGLLDDSFRNMNTPPKISNRLKGANFLEIQSILENYVRNCCHMAGASREKNKSDNLVEDMKYQIDTYLDFSGLTLEWLSGQLHFSPNYIRQTFKQKTGESFVEYLIRKRMERAGKLLTDSDMKIQDIAQNCGYSNQKYFTSSFRKYYGCTPTGFREMIQDNE